MLVCKLLHFFTDSSKFSEDYYGIIKIRLQNNRLCSTLEVYIHIRIHIDTVQNFKDTLLCLKKSVYRKKNKFIRNTFI